jgi:long-chain acyl-CoA synthetase
MAFEARFNTLVDIYDHATRAYAERPLFGTKRGSRWEWTTYRDFATVVDKLRGGLASLGIARGDCVAIVSNNRVEWAALAYACYGLGAAFVPMYEAQHPKDWEFIVNDCSAKALVVANDAILEKARPLLDSIASLGHMISLAPVNGAGGSDKRITSYQALLDAGKQAPPIRPALEDTATLIYTSGTTGNPKGVILTHYNIASNISAVHEVFPMEAADRSLSFLPWAHSFGQTCELHVLFSAGASMAICESVDKIIDDLAEVQPTLLLTVPRIFNKLYTAVQKQLASKPKPIQALVKKALEVTAKERTGTRLRLHELAVLKLVDKLVFEKVRARFGGRLKYVISGGAALSRDVAEFIDSLGIVVYEGYGLTETSPIATVNWPSEKRIGSVGRAVPGVRIEIDKATGEKKPAEPAQGGPQACRGGKPARFEGEIVVYGPNVMKGYYKRPEENAAVFTPDGGLKTGDMGYLDAHGFLYITGRIKEQYKLENGKYVVPTPLEEQLKLSAYIANVMIYGDNRPYNVALVVANADAVKEWARANGVPGADDFDALVKNAAVHDLLTKEIDKYGETFKGFEVVKDFAIVSQDFTTDNGMLTPSLKLKRRKVLEVHGKTLEELYAKKREKTAPAPTAAA